MSEYKCNTEGCSADDCDNCLAVSALRTQVAVLRSRLAAERPRTADSLTPCVRCGRRRAWHLTDRLYCYSIMDTGHAGFDSRATFADGAA